MGKKLLRSKSNKVVAGVCAGIADYLNVDPAIVRICWVVLSFASLGTGVIAYIIAAVIIPEGYHTTGNPMKSGLDDWDLTSDHSTGDWGSPVKYDSGKNRTMIGAIIIGIGVLLFAKQFLGWISFWTVFPVFLIAIGLFIIYKGGKNYL